MESARDQTELQRHCSHYSSVMGDIDEKDLAKEIERFKHVLLRDETIKTAYEHMTSLNTCTLQYLQERSS